MNPFHILITSAALFSLTSVHADPMHTQETSAPIPFTESEASEMTDDDLALLDEESDDAFEEEILALEEELKQDAAFPEDAIPVKEEVAEVEEDSPAMASLLDEETHGMESDTLFEESTLATEEFSEEIEEFDEQEALAQAEQETDLSAPEMDEENGEIAQESPEMQFETTPLVPVEMQRSHRTPAFTRKERMPRVELINHATPPVAVEQVFAQTPTLAWSDERIETTAPSVEEQSPETVAVDLQHAFAGAPVIYTLLGCMSIFAVGTWLYSFLMLRKQGSISHVFLKNLQNKLNSNQFEDALALCTTHQNVFSKMISTGIMTRRHGLAMMIEAMKAEGKRASVPFWQRIGLLNDIAIIAPMIGLLGTVLGMFYAFYDINRSIQSISTLFDGLGISVGTTVAGLIVAILALILHSTIKFRLVKTLSTVENEAHSFATLIDDRTSIYKS